MTEPTDVIRLFLDDDKEPFKTARPPLRFQFSTMHLADGIHRLRVEAHNGLAGDSVKEIPFSVRNGVAITVSGLMPEQEIAGQVGLVINAYAGNTEIDFEPSRAETPQPIPTWAWLIFLGIIAWTMFYVLNPTSKPAAAASTGVSSSVGQRVYDDVCAKCHQEDGSGAPGLGPAQLRDADMVISADPSELVGWVCAGPIPEGGSAKPGGEGKGGARMRMLPFGPPRLRPMEFVAALNYIRTHWGNQAPPIEPETRRAPDPIRQFENRYVEALQKRDFVEIERLYSRNPDLHPRMVRRGLDDADVVDVSDASEIRKTFENWLLKVKEVNSISTHQVAFATMDGGRIIYAHGRMILTVTPRGGEGPNEEPLAARAYEGQFVRIYRLESADPDERGMPSCDPNGNVYRLLFDYATAPMDIGCPADRTLEQCDPKLAGRISYGDVQRILGTLGQTAPQAPHGNFWTLPYKEFVELKFPYKPIPGGVIRLINLTPKDRAAGISGAETNLVRALRDGRDILVDLPDGSQRPVVIDRMPKKSKEVPRPDLGRIISWLDHGYPETLPAIVRPPAMSETAMSETAMSETAMTEPAAMNGTNGTTSTSGATLTEWRADDVDFAGLIELLTALKLKAQSAPHGEFWKYPYDKFVKFKFHIDSDDSDATLVECGDPERSNFLRALKRQPLLVTKADGKPGEYDIGRAMPPKGKGTAPTPEQLDLIARWIAHGCPEKKPAAGGGEPPAAPATPAASAPGTPSPSPAAMDGSPPPTPAAPPAPAAMDGAPAPAAMDDAASADKPLDFAAVVALIASWKPKAGSAPHGEFWKLPYAKFIEYEFPVYSEDGKARLVVPGKPDESNLIRALERKPLLVKRDADGKIVEFDPGKSMPPKGKGTAPKPEEIARIKQWIADGCPEKR